MTAVDTVRGTLAADGIWGWQAAPGRSWHLGYLDRRLPR